MAYSYQEYIRRRESIELRYVPQKHRWESNGHTCDHYLGSLRILRGILSKLNTLTCQTAKVMLLSQQCCTYLDTLSLSLYTGYSCFYNSTALPIIYLRMHSQHEYTIAKGQFCAQLGKGEEIYNFLRNTTQTSCHYTQMTFGM